MDLLRVSDSEKFEIEVELKTRVDTLAHTPEGVGIATSDSLTPNNDPNVAGPSDPGPEIVPSETWVLTELASPKTTSTLFPKVSTTTVLLPDLGSNSTPTTASLLIDNGDPRLQPKDLVTGYSMPSLPPAAKRFPTLLNARAFAVTF
jgi:hypothetical protein